MASNGKPYSDDTWVVDICEILQKVEELQNSHDRVLVSVSQVPKTLRPSNPEAFIPQFVGFGPYHHYKSDLIMDDKLKLDSSKRALKHFLHLDTNILQQRLKSILSHSYIQAFYHIDVCKKYTYQTLLYMLTVDCLFLLGLLYRTSTTKPQQEHSFFLTGKQGIAMVNAAGVEMTMDSIMRDIFMLENQIPTYFLKQVKEAVIITSNNSKNINEIESSQEEAVAYQDLGSTMKFFCETLCPFVHEYKLSKVPEDHDHLLDLMYHLIVDDLPKNSNSNLNPNSGTASQPPETLEFEPPSQDDDNLSNNTQPLLETKNSNSNLKPNSGAASQPPETLEFEPPSQDDDNLSNNTQPLLETQNSNSNLNPNSGTMSEDVDNSKDKTQVNTCCSVFCNLLGILFGCLVVVCIFIYFTLRFFIFPIILWILKTLFSFIKWVLRPLAKLSKLTHPLVEALYNLLSEMENYIPFVKPWTKLFGEIKKTSEKIGQEDYLTHWDNNTKVTIRSVTELHNAGIKFQPLDKVKNGILSIAFEEINCQFCLPVIKLDVHSEVIIRNLMAYESLIKPNELIFTRYVELMGAIIDTPEDVKLLMNEKIIETELSYEVVTQLFNGMMGTSTRPTKVQDLDQVIKKVNAKFKNTQAQKIAMVRYMSACVKMLTAIAAIVFLVLTAVQTYCSAFGCARN